MEKNNKVCMVCGTRYTYCRGCGKDNGKPEWMAYFHNQNCHDIFEVCKDYKQKVVSAEEAKRVLSALDLSEKNLFPQSIKDILAELYPVVRQSKKKPFLKERSEEEEDVKAESAEDNPS